LAGGIVLGLAQSLGAQLHPQGFLIGGHLVFLLVLFARLFPLRGALLGKIRTTVRSHA
jgi:branched-chain amino acid transport system permease protein